jgi:hypothetical protein
MELSTQRSRLAGEIHNEMERLEDPEDPGSGTVTGSSLLNVSTALLSDRDRIDLEECRREDGAVFARYTDALNRELPLEPFHVSDSSTR